MPVTEEGRHRLHQALDRTIGPEEATTLMEHLPPVGWADVATKTDLDNLRTATKTDLTNLRTATKTDLTQLQEHLDHRFEMVDLRFETERANTDGHLALLRAHTDARFDALELRFGEVGGRFDLTDERLRHADRRFDEQRERSDALDRRLDATFDAIDRRLISIENRLTHQFWQFLTFLVAYGAVLVGVLRYT